MGTNETPHIEATVGCVVTAVSFGLSVVLPLYIGWIWWQHLGPSSWLLGDGFAWWLAKVILTVSVVGFGTRLLYMLLMMLFATIFARRG